MALNLLEAQYQQNTVDCLPPTYYHAQWKGLWFHIENSADEFGRRIDVYEYPLGNDIGVKDLGRKARRFKLEGYLIGHEQEAFTRAIAHSAEDPEPGYLQHPMFGQMLVACINLTVTADYRRDKKRTKLVFEFVEAAESWAPFVAGNTINDMWLHAMNAIGVSKFNGDGTWNPSEEDLQYANDISKGLAGIIPYMPGNQIDAWDAKDTLDQLGSYLDALQPVPFEDRWTGTEPALARVDPVLPSVVPMTRWSPLRFASIIAPIDYASAVIRQFHLETLNTLRKFNAYVVSRAEASPSAQALIQTVRLIIMRDYSITVAQTKYRTSTEAFRDLDFIMAVLDDEEAIATQKCDDAVVDAVRRMRATAASVILSRNIRLPGVANYSADGLWPSLVIANKLYFDGRRHEEVENYNPTMLNFWMGRNVVAPMR